MALQAFIDDSYESNGPYVLGGHIATAENWTGFAKDWDPLVQRFGDIDSLGRRYFKMRSMIASAERRQWLPAFERVISAHVIVGVSCSFDMRDLVRAHARVHVPGFAFVPPQPFAVAFYMLLTSLNSARDQFANVLPKDEKIDFYFDEQTEKGPIITTWEQFLANRTDEERKYYGTTPRFEDDKEVLPLQAADYWAWWQRAQLVGNAPDRIGRMDTRKTEAIQPGQDTSGFGFKSIHFTSTEDQLTETLIRWAADALKHTGVSRTIYDVRAYFGRS